MSCRMSRSRPCEIGRRFAPTPTPSPGSIASPFGPRSCIAARSAGRKRIKEASDTYTAKHGLTEGTRSEQTGGDPLAVILSSERHAQLRIAMSKLPVKDLEMLLLKHVDDCSYQEIGKRLGVTAGVVQMRLFRARQKLRETLLQQYPEE